MNDNGIFALLSIGFLINVIMGSVNLANFVDNAQGASLGIAAFNFSIAIFLLIPIAVRTRGEE